MKVFLTPIKQSLAVLKNIILNYITSYAHMLETNLAIT